MLVLIALIGATKFNVNRQTSKVVDDELKRLQNGGSMSDATPVAKKTINELSGIDYDQIKVWKK